MTEALYVRADQHAEMVRFVEMVAGVDPHPDYEGVRVGRVVWMTNDDARSARALLAAIWRDDA